MRCYYHRDVDAIATCRSCNRGLCESCAAEVNKATACRGRCETEVADMRAMLQRGADTTLGYGRVLRIAALLCVSFAALFVVLSRRMPYAMASGLLLPAAFLLLLGAMLLVVTARRYDADRRGTENR